MSLVYLEKGNFSRTALPEIGKALHDSSKLWGLNYLCSCNKPQVLSIFDSFFMKNFNHC